MRPLSAPRLFFHVSLAIASLASLGSLTVCQTAKVRPATVAGSFYPADPGQLGKMIDGFLAQAGEEKIDGDLLALVSPHAGYEYSGSVAAHSYAMLKGRKYERVVVIAPSHLEAFPFASIYDGDAYTTPLGTIPIDKELASKLAGMNSLIKISGQGHGIVEGRGEHALEDQLPFLQRTLGEFKLVPIVMGDQNYDLERALGVSLAKVLKGSKGSTTATSTLIVASSDLSHFHPYNEAVKLDRKVLDGIADYDYFSLSQNFERRIWEACGGGPIVAAMIAAERLGANRAIVLKYANSGDATGDKSRVVGYGAAALVAERKPAAKKAARFSLPQNEKDALMRIARRSVETAVKEQKFAALEDGLPESLTQARGAFVTLKERGELRGCIGYVTPTKALAETVRDVAAFAALKDPRFPPITVAELGQLEYEVSVLSPLKRVTDFKQIRVGRDGLVVRKGEYEGLLLPQVPTEQRWDRQTFLEQTCVKAGLPTQAWQDEETDVFSFSALVFGEHTAAEPPTDESPAATRPTRPGAPGQGPPHP